MPSPNSIRFGSFELLAGELRLLKNGVDVAVEPKAVELIAYLAERPGRVVGKEELLEAVWSGEVVGDGALTRCIHIARRALGEGGRHPRWIHTMHGRGYRFAEDLGTEAKRPVATSYRGRWRDWRVLSLTVVFAIASIWWVRSPSQEALPTPRVESARSQPAVRPEILTLVGMAAAEKDRELALVGISVVDLLHQRLDETDGLIVRPPVYEQEQSADGEWLTETAERTGASALLTVAVAESLDPGRVKVAIELHQLGREDRRSTPLGDYSLPRLERGASLEDLLVLREAVTSRIRDQLAPILVAPPPSRRAAPRDPEAYRLYLIGYQRLRESYCGGASGAIELFERSLEIDDRYGPAWLWLGVAHYNQVWACGADASVYGQALDAIDRALEVDPDLRVARTQKAALLLETGRIATAFEVLADELDRFGETPILLGTRSYALRIAGFLDPSLDDLRRLLELDPLAFENGMSGGSPNTWLYLDRPDEFLAALPTLEMPYFRYYRGFVAVLQGREEDARSTLEPAYRQSPGSIFGRMSQALLEILDGDPGRAQEIVVSISRQREALGAIGGEITYKQAQLLSLAGDHSGALEELGKSVSQGFSCPRCFLLDPTLEGLRASSEFSEVLASARRAHERLARRFALDAETGGSG